MSSINSRHALVASFALPNQSTNLRPKSTIHKGTQSMDFMLCETIILPDNANIKVVVDMDGDDVLDIVVSNHESRTITVLERQDGEFVPRLTITETGQLRGHAVADINRDGLPEVSLQQFLADSYKFGRHREIMNMYRRIQKIVGNFIEGAVGGDVDGDGQLEFLVARESFPSRGLHHWLCRWLISKSREYHWCWRQLERHRGI